MTAFEISDRISLSVVAVRRALNRLYENGEVEFIKHPHSKLRLWRTRLVRDGNR